MTVVANKRSASRRRGNAREAKLAARQTSSTHAVVKSGQPGGKFKALTEPEIHRIYSTALDLLETVGMAEATPDVQQMALAAGCTLGDDGRLLMPRALVEDFIAGAAREYTIFGRDPKHDLQIGKDRVHFSTCGEAVQTLDLETREYRPSSLQDVYDFARLADRMEHIHMFAQTVISNELSGDVMLHDTNVAFAMMSGTTKHASMAVMDATSVDDVFAMAHMFAGGDEAFRARPFFSVGQCPVVSPLKYGVENSDALVKAIKYGAPVEFAVVPQSGATGPAALAGNLVLSTAEALAGLVLVNLVSRGHPASVGNWPFVSDLRTGAFSGGSGEEAIMSAAAAQIINYLDLPSHTAAGMSDSKLPDAQAGYEKALANTLAGMSGCNLIYESAGMLGSLMCCSFEAMVIDNDMLGSIQRSLRGIEVTDETLSFDVIKEAALGPGHFLGHGQTLAMMETEYLYPNVANRDSYDQWKTAGSRTTREAAAVVARDILDNHFPIQHDPQVEAAVRERFDIRLAPEQMRPKAG
ncbi:MAG: methyltransferase [Rhodobacteraceae bacterium]|nr:methyltransferase [Paracoccaceae bacterium]